MIEVLWLGFTAGIVTGVVIGFAIGRVWKRLEDAL